MDLITIICLTLVIVLLLQALKAQRKAALAQRREQRRLNNVILGKEMRITSLKYLVKDQSAKLVAKACDYATVCDNLDDCLDTIKSQEALLRLKDEELNRLEKRQDVASTMPGLLPNAHRELLLDEIQDHKNTKMLLDLATTANLELKLQAEALEAVLAIMKGYEAGGDDVLDSEIQAMEELRQDVYISEPGSAATDGRALDSAKSPDVVV